jgi:hypothetical protein
MFELSSHDSGKAPGQLLVHALTWVGTSVGGPAAEKPAMILAHLLLFGLTAVGVWMIARRIWLDPSARRPTAQVAAWGWALLTVILLAPMLGAWYLVWVLPLAWALPRVARRTLVILCVAFTVTELVTENSNLPELLRSVRLPFGHPVAIAVCLWIGVDLVRRLRRGVPLDAETPEHQFGDAFEAGPLTREPVAERPPVEREPDLTDEPADVIEVRQPGGALSPLSLAKRR